MSSQPQRYMPSILTRLIDDDFEGRDWAKDTTLEQIMSSVMEDLKDLLNTHPSLNELPEEFKELRTSILAYGMPDLASLAVVARTRQQQLTQVVQTIITRFEPRLRDVKATMTGGEHAGDRNVAFSIKAVLRTEPFPPVAFETVFDLMTGQAEIKQAEKAT